TEFSKHGKQTQDAVCEATGIVKSKYSDLERPDRTRKATAADIALLAEHYGVSADYLLGLTDVPTPKEADITAVCEYMGYSTETIKNLREIKTQPFFIADEPEEYDQNGNLISKWHEEPSKTLLREPDEGMFADVEDYTKAEAKQAVDRFFSADGIADFFTEIAHVQKVLSQEPFLKGSREDHYALISFAESCMQIAKKVFSQEGDN
ncbi:MAG: hypothetical protein IKI37_07750, partial [Oscillospiraceae bacterium]|nr:hypothetical protein [Oscillospiraceae bacterium]